MLHKGFTGRSETNGPASSKNDIGRRGTNERYLREYIARKQESDSFFDRYDPTDPSTYKTKKKLAFDEYWDKIYKPATIGQMDLERVASMVWKAAQENS